MFGDMPGQIMTVVVSLIILGVGIFAFFTTQSQIEVDPDQVQTFTVSDPTTDQHLALTYGATEIASVYQYTGTAWIEVDSTYYTASGVSVVVNSTTLFH